MPNRHDNSNRRPIDRKASRTQRGDRPGNVTCHLTVNPSPHHPITLSPARRRTRGQALVPVIFIMLILTTLVVAFELSASRELRSGANFSAQTQRYYAARGAVAYAASALSQTSANGATYGIVPPGPDT